MTVKEQVYKEIESLPLEAQKKLLKIIHFLKTEIFTERKKSTKARDALQEIDTIAFETGISDFANQHDHYLYNTQKK